VTFTIASAIVFMIFFVLPAPERRGIGPIDAMLKR
jgi:hypothetical protein